MPSRRLVEPWYRTITAEQWRTLLAAKLGWMLDAMDFMLYAVALGPILLSLNQSATVYVPRVSKQPVDGNRETLRDVENFPATLKADRAALTAKEPSTCPSPTPCRNSSAETSLRL